MAEQFRLFGAYGPDCPGCESGNIVVRQEGYRLFDLVETDDSDHPEGFLLMGSHDGVWSDLSLICRDCGGTWPAAEFSDFPEGP